MKKLNKRQWKLHDLLVDGNKHPTSEIINKIEEYNTGKARDTNRSLHDRSFVIRTDIEVLNNSAETNKLFYHDDDYNFFLLDKSGAKLMMDKLHNVAMKKLLKVSVYRKKCGYDGQYKFIDNKGNVISEESLARPYVETFIK